MTFPPARSPLYTAMSFNGRPIISLRSGLYCITRNYFLCVCRYIQKLLTELANEAQYLDKARRHPALPYDPFEAHYNANEEKSSNESVSVLCKLVEKQSEQQYELMEKLTQV